LYIFFWLEPQKKPGHSGILKENRLAFLAGGSDNTGMPRTARADLGGYCYHALNRGNGRATMFHDHDDYQTFVRLLRDACARLPMRLLSFCLLPNHFHLVLWPQADDQLGPWMQWLLTAHVHGYRKRYGGSGHVWQGKIKGDRVLYLGIAGPSVGESQRG
jgi:REP element-mobilizing transposase RayT